MAQLNAMRQRARTPSKACGSRMIPKSGNRFSEKIMRKKNITDVTGSV